MENKFNYSRREEIRGFVANDTFKVMGGTLVSKETRIFVSKFVNFLKPTDKGF